MHLSARFSRALLLGALALAGCPAPAETFDDAAFRDLLTEASVGEPYNGVEESSFFWTEQMWRTALTDDPPSTTVRHFYRRGEPIWHDEGWVALTDRLDEALRRHEWRPAGSGLTAEYVRGWQGGRQRLVVARHRTAGDSTGYVVTAVLATPE